MNIKEFDLKTLPSHFSMIINGVRRSGKSRLTDWMINEIYNNKDQHFDDCYLLSSTAKQQDDVFQWVDKEKIIDELSDDKIRDIFKEREQIVEHYKKNSDLYKHKPNALIIIDDLLSDAKGKSLWYSKPINELFFKGRHMLCTIIVLTQYVKALNPLMRSNADVLCYFRDLREDNRKCVLSEYLCFCNDKEIQKKGEQLMTDITSERFHGMLVNRYAGQYANKYEDYVFKIKAPEKYYNNKVTFQKLPKVALSFKEDTAEMEDKLIINNALRTKKGVQIEKPKKRILL